MNKSDLPEKIAGTLVSLKDIPAPNPMRKASARQAYLEHAARLRAAPAQVSRKRSTGRIHTFLRLATASFSAFILSLGILSGVAYAADGAQPGDPLYFIDRKTEELQLRVTSDPEREVRLMISFANERVLESQRLAQKGDLKNMAIALNAYNQTIPAIAQKIGKAGAQKETLSVELDAALLVQEERLSAIRAQDPRQALPVLDRAIGIAHNVDLNGAQEAEGSPGNNGTPESSATNKPHSTPTAKDRGPSGSPTANPGKPVDAGKPDNPGQPTHPGKP